MTHVLNKPCLLICGVAIILGVVSCQEIPGSPQSMLNMPVVFVNYSDSSTRYIPEEVYSRVVNTCLLHDSNVYFSFWVVARYPLNLRLFNSGLSLTYDGIKSQLYSAYEAQVRGEDPQGIPWGWGTDHTAVLQRIADERISGLPLVVVGITDGENEQFGWEGVQTALTNLFSGGPTHLILVGLSQHVIRQGDITTTVLDQWQNACQAAGAADLMIDPTASKGYLVVFDARIPDWALDLPQKEVQL